MTNLEKTTRSTLLQFVLDSLGATELNPVTQVKEVQGTFIGERELEVEMDNGEKKTLSIKVIDSDE